MADMEKPRIGMNALDRLNAQTLSEAVQTVQDYGFDCMELTISALPLLIEGEICMPVLRHTKAVLERYDLTYTAHIGTGLNLRSRPDFALHRRVLLASIDVCAALGIDRLTLHFEQASRIQEEEEQFFQAHAEAAAYAEERGVLLLIENIEIEAYQKVIDLVRRVNRENFKMTLDTGHLYLSTRYFGGDYLQAVRDCAPYVRHVHLNDNTGRFEPMRLTDFARYKMLGMNMRTAFGAGDIHLPPLWGRVPLAETVEILHESGYQGVFLCEYDNMSYLPFGREIQQGVRSLVNAIYTAPEPV